MLLPLPGCGKQAAEAFDAGQAMAPVTEAPVTPGPTAYAVPITMAPTATPSPTPTFTPEPTPEPTATPKPTPSPTPTSVPMDRRDFEAEVQDSYYNMKEYVLPHMEVVDVAREAMLSLGIQPDDDEILKKLGRPHT